MDLLTFRAYSDHSASADDNLTGIAESALLTESISPTVAKAAALALLLKMTQLGHTMQSADSKALSSEIILLGSMIALAIATMTPDSPRR